MARKLPNRIDGGLFISLEGGEGSGKSTLIRCIKGFLEQEGYDVLITREPGGPPISEAIRGILLDPENTAMDPLTELFLYLASRRQNLVERIRPMLNCGGVVISDRFADASIAYQGGARELGLERVDRLNLEAIDGMFPELTFFLDLDPAEGMRRGPATRAENDGRGDRIEREALDFHHRVRDAYRTWARRYPDRIRVLDAGQPADKVAETAILILQELLTRKESI